MSSSESQEPKPQAEAAKPSTEAQKEANQAPAASSTPNPAAAPAQAEDDSGVKELVVEIFEGLAEDVAIQLRMCAAGVMPGAGKKKKKKGAAEEKKGPAKSAPSTTASRGGKKAAAETKPAPKRPYDPPKFAQIKLPKGTGIEVDIARIEALLTGWGDPSAINVPDPETGETALHLACSAGRQQVVSVLLLKGAAIDATDASVRTPLYTAACNGHLDICTQLLDAGADKAAVNKWGNTPLHAACRNSQQDVAEFLMCIGLDSRRQNNDGKDCFARAKTPEFLDWMKKLDAEVQARREKRKAAGQPEFESSSDFFGRISKRKKKPSTAAAAAPAASMRGKGK